MKPNFTLSLSFEGIRLLHRAAGGWRVVGEVAVDSDDLTGELAILRKTAAGLEPGGVRTKLLIPNDQIKYLTIDTPGLSETARMDAARAALEGATPYAVDDLAFDIDSDGAKTHIAAVALETLSEAEAFANEHRFHPVSFVAQPKDQDFSGEPFFGMTTSASDLLDPGEKVDPDKDAIVVLSGPAVAAQAPKVTPAPAVAAKSDVTPSEKPAASAPGGDGQIAQPLESEKPAADDKPALPQPVTAQDTEKTSQPNPAPEAKAPKVVAEDKSKTAAASVKSDAAAKAPTAPRAEPPAAFASRRSAPAAPSSAAPHSVQAPAVGGASRAATAATVASAIPVALKPDSSSLTPPPPIATDKPGIKGFLSRRKPRKEGAAPAARPAAALAATSGVSVPPSQTEADQMTIFGARKNATVGGKPRYLGILLTAALLIFLAGVAAWASVFLDDGISLSRLFGNRDTTAVASAPPAETAVPTPVQAPTTADPTAESEMESDTVVASVDPALSDEDGAVLDALRVPELTQPRELSEQQLEAKYATDGIWAISPETPNAPAMISLDDLYMTSIDPISTSSDAVALPELASFGGDSLNMAFASPAPAGTSFALDDRGLVLPTEAGALNPDGVLVFAGRPDVIPPAGVDRAEVVEAVQTAAQEDDPLLEFRPRVRPEGLIENNERSELGGLTRSELASLRPALRPQSVQQAAAAASAPEVPAPEVTAAAAAAGASLAAAVTAPAPVSAINNATAYAVKASIRPDTRPRNFARIVERAQRTAPAPTQVASAASVAPRTVKPSIPSSTSVAKQATVKNAMKMRNINLIGVYGKPSSRRALIRLSNGRYQKVAVGDRLDGGRVSAIGDSELRYQRRGRDVVLRIPSG